MNKKLLGIMAIATMLSGYQINTPQVETSVQTSDGQMQEANQFTAIDVYASLNELIQAFETATSSNARSEIPNEKVYYLSEDNDLGLSLANIQVREGYFKCTYDEGVLLITERLSDGAVGLDVLTTNNPDSFTKKQGNGYEYYYDSGDNVDYYF